MMCIRTNIMIEFLGQLGQERWSTRDSTTPMTPCLSNKKICKEQMFTYKHISSYHILSLCIKSHGATLLGHFCTTGLDALPQRAKKPEFCWIFASHQVGFTPLVNESESFSSFKSIPAGFPDGCLGCLCVWDHDPLKACSTNGPHQNTPNARKSLARLEGLYNQSRCLCWNALKTMSYSLLLHDRLVGAFDPLEEY